MKTLTKTLFALLVASVTLTSAVSAKTIDVDNNVTTLTSVKNISKIVVSGNVNLILIQDNKESVKVYDKYYSKNAMVQQQGGTLRICSFEDKPLSVVVFVNNLSSIEASNQSKVRTEGRFQLLNLEVKLSDRATADINANTVSLFTSVKDASDLKIAGTTDSHIILMGDLANLTMDQFAANETSISSKPTIALARR
jgi:hypothetical protein